MKCWIMRSVTEITKNEIVYGAWIDAKVRPSESYSRMCGYAGDRRQVLCINVQRMKFS